MLVYQFGCPLAFDTKLFVVGKLHVSNVLLHFMTMYLMSAIEHTHGLR